MGNIWKIIAKTAGARFYNLAIGVVVLALTARFLGAEGRGQMAAVITWVGMFATISHLSLGQVAINEASKSHSDYWLYESFGSLLFWAISTTVISLLLAYALYFFTDGSLYGNTPATLLTIGCFMLPFMVWEKQGSALLTALERLDIYNRNQIIGKTIGLLVLLFLVIGNGLGVEGALIAILAGQMVIAAGGFYMLWSLTGGPKLFKWVLNFKYLRRGLTLHFNAIGVYLFSASDILMLNYFKGAEETGYYQLGAQLMGVMMVIPQAAAMVLYGKVSSLGVDKAWLYQKKLLVQISLMMIVIAVLAGLTANWWLIWFAGEAFFPTIGVFHWQLLSVVGMTFATLMAPQWIGRAYFLGASLLTLVIGLGNLIANALLIPEYGMYGAIWASLGVYVIAIIGNGWMALHCQRKCLEVSL